jgi:SNF2 family DNA or RNA helicase
VPKTLNPLFAFQVIFTRGELQNLEAILRERCATPGASKVLLFSSFDNSFAAIGAMLTRLGVRHRFLKGNHFSVSLIEREYRDSTLDVLLVNTSNYGSGLNFENTTDVIMLHKFDTDIEKQVVGRAQRCGRTQPLNVWYLLYENEMPTTPPAPERV